MRMGFLRFFGMLLPMVFHGNPVAEEALQKIYVEPAQIAFSDQWILACIEGEWVSVDAIYRDAQGLYVLNKNPYHSRWICPECWFNNNGWDETCQNDLPSGKCGYPRPW